LAVFTANIVLLRRIQRPGELVESVVEIVTEVSSGLSPRLIVLGKI
jgi:hypothetical protein